MVVAVEEEEEEVELGTNPLSAPDEDDDQVGACCRLHIKVCWINVLYSRAGLPSNNNTCTIFRW